MARTIVKHIGILSLAKLYGILLFVVGGFFAVLYGLGMILISLLGEGGAGLAVGGVFVLLLGPFLYGVLGFLSGALMALVYNVAAKIVGGLELELE